MNTSVVGSAHPTAMSGRAVSPCSTAARPTAGIPLCHYDDGNLSAAYITLPYGVIGWCRGHLKKIDE